MLSSIYSLPLWALALLLSVGLIGIALGALWLFRRYVLPRFNIGDDADLYFTATVMQSAMMLYALVAALTAVSVWNRHTSVSGIVSHEATVIGSLWRDLGGYPEAERLAMQSTLRDYTKQVIEFAWPEQREGRTPRQGVEYMNRLQDQLFSFEPTLESHKILHAETLGAFNRLNEARRQRLDALDEGLPSIMWYVLLPGALGCIALCFFFKVRDMRFQAIAVSALSGFIAMVLFVTIALDQPYRGPMAISSESYQLIYDHLMKP